MPPVRLAELSPEVQQQLKARGVLRAPRRRSMTMDEVRTAAIRVLNVVADLTPGERRRVLKHAAKLNDV